MAKKAKAKKRTTRKSRKVILPMKLSSLIKICLKDIRRAEATPTCIINMDEWFEREIAECAISNGMVVETHEYCIMCAAGSVMAFTLGALTKKEHATAYPSDFPDNAQQLQAIDELRCGQVSGAARCIWPDTENVEWGQQSKNDKKLDQVAKFNCNIPDYDRDKPEPFHKAMTKLQEKLAKAGL